MSRAHAEARFRETWALHDNCCHSQWSIGPTGRDTVHLRDWLTLAVRVELGDVDRCVCVSAWSSWGFSETQCVSVSCWACVTTCLSLSVRSLIENAFVFLALWSSRHPPVSLLLSAQHGFSVYKSVPYGSVEDTLPYLVRRAQENRSVLQGIRKERDLLRLELRRRLREKITGARSA